MSLSEALHDATKLGAFVENFTRAKAVLEAAAAVEGSINSLKAQEAAARKRTEEAEENADRAEAAMGAAQEALADARRRADQAVLDARTEGQRIVSKALVEAERVKAEAGAKAAEVEKQAEKVREELRSAHSEINRLKVEESALKDRIAQAMADARARFGG